jgi:hypothetical protein
MIGAIIGDIFVLSLPRKPTNSNKGVPKLDSLIVHTCRVTSVGAHGPLACVAVAAAAYFLLK